MEIKRILCHLDADQENELLEDVLRFAKACHAQVTVVDTVHDFSWLVRLTLREHEQVLEQLVDGKVQQLQALVAPYAEKGLGIQCKVLRGRSSVGIVQEVLRGKYDLVIKRAKGAHSIREGLIGTTGLRLMRQCPCPVLLASRGNRLRFERLLAAVDVTPGDDDHLQLNDAIMATACGLRSLLDAQLDVTHSWSVYGEVLLKEHMRPEEFEELVDGSRQKSETVFSEFAQRFELGPSKGDQLHLMHGDPSLVLPKLIVELNSDLLVMGTSARAGVSGFLFGNTAEAVLGQVKCSVLAVKPPGFVSPVTLEDE